LLDDKAFIGLLDQHTAQCSCLLLKYSLIVFVRNCSNRDSIQSLSETLLVKLGIDRGVTSPNLVAI